MKTDGGTAWARLATGCGLVCLSAAILVFSFPYFDLGALAWVGLVPWLAAVSEQRPRRAFLLSYLAAWILFSGIFYWIWRVPAFNVVDYLLLASFLALFGGVFGLGLAWLRRKSNAPLALLAPPLWVAVEYLRSHAFFLGAPWMLLGHSQYLHPSLIQIVSLTGVYGLSFVIVLVNACLADLLLYGRAKLRAGDCSRRMLKPFPLSSLLYATLVLVGTLVYGQVVLSKEPSDQSVTVALIQGNIPQKQKWDKAYRQATLEQYSEMTLRAALATPDLIVWPETAVPGDIQNEPELQRLVADLAVQTHTPLLVGTAVNAKFTEQRLPGRSFNTMLLIGPDGRIAGEYRKIQLVPFAEYTPLKDWMSWPAVISSPRTDILPGDQLTVFRVGEAAFAVTICWENIFPDFVREFAQKDIHFIVNATNEAHFGNTAAPYQLLAMNVFRAAEHRIAIARVGNSGISALIDSSGRITERLHDSRNKELFVAGFLVNQVRLSHERTLYTSFGDLFAFLQISLSALLLLHSWLKDARIWIRLRETAFGGR